MIMTEYWILLNSGEYHKVCRRKDGDLYVQLKMKHTIIMSQNILRDTEFLYILYFLFFTQSLLNYSH